MAEPKSSGVDELGATAMIGDSAGGASVENKTSPSAGVLAGATDPMSTAALLEGMTSSSMGVAGTEIQITPSDSSRRGVGDSGQNQGPASYISGVEGLKLADIPGAKNHARTLKAFGPFARVELLAEQGAMGLVARGYNAAFDRWELLKFLKPELANEPELLRQFQREGRVLAKLSHPNVVQVFATYQVDGQPCLAMEFLQGESLASWIESHSGKGPISEWYEHFADAARGMAAAHDVGLLHRDIKPENLFVVSARKGGSRGLKLIDFGLATADRTKMDLASTDKTLLAQTKGGTPLFMAPELWRGEDASPRSDIFAMGMTFFNAATGAFPFELGTLPQVVMAITSPDPFVKVREIRRDLPPAFAAIVDKALAKRKEDRFATADELVAALIAAAGASRSRRVPGSGPYRGLEKFTAAERDVFFGREEEIAEVLERLRNSPGVLIAGPSGAGKSSLVHAGVVPNIEEGALGGGLVFRSASMEPRAHPCISLASALAQGTGAPEKDLLTFLRTSPEKTGDALREALPQDTALVLVVDQIEEVSTIAVDPKEVHDFAVALASMVEVLSPQLRVLATIRADLMDRLFAMEPLRAFLTRGFYPVRPMGPVALRKALEEPARAAGFMLEDVRIAEAIVMDVAKTPAGLPLMSFAMAAWWKTRDESRKLLPTASWLALGGLGGALARHGDAVLDSMSAEERACAELILPRLVSAEGTRTRVQRSSLTDPAATGPAAGRALDLLLQSKLVLETSGEIELAHEALISQWQRLRDLLVTAGEDRSFRERVASAAREWDAQGRPDGALWTDEQAQRLLGWFVQTKVPLGQQELAFIEAIRRSISWKKLLRRSLLIAALLTTVTLALVAMRRERITADKLEESKREVVSTTKKYKASEGGRLQMLAELQLQTDPGAALRTTLKSIDMGQNPALDTLAWQARALGVPLPLPIHQGGASHARFSATSAWLAIGGADGALHILSTKNSEHSAIRPDWDGNAALSSIAFDPGSDMVATGTVSGKVSVADPPKFKPKNVAVGCERPIASLAFVKTGQLLSRCGASSEKAPSKIQVTDLASNQHSLVYEGPIDSWTVSKEMARAYVIAESSLKVIDISSGKKVAESPLSVGPNRITTAGVSPDESSIVFGDTTGQVYLTSLKDYKVDKRREWSKLEGALVSTSFSPAGMLLLIAERGPAILWDSSLSQSSSIGHVLPVYSWISQRDALALAGPEHDVILVATQTRQVVAKLVGATGNVTTLSASPNGQWLVAGSADGASRAYEVDLVLPRVQTIQNPAPAVPTQGRLVSVHVPKQALGANNPSNLCAISSDATSVGCVLSQFVRVQGVGGSTGGLKEPKDIALNGATPSVFAISPRGEHVVWCAESASCSLDGTSTGPVMTSPKAAFSPEKGHLALAGMVDNKPTLTLVLSGASKSPTIKPFEQPIVSLFFAHDEGSLFVGLNDGQVIEVELGTGEWKSPIVSTAWTKGATLINHAVSDDGSMIVLADNAGRVVVASTRGKNKDRVLARLTTPVSCLLVSQTNRAIFAAGSSQPLGVFDLDSPVHFDAVDPNATILQCARSTIDDRIVLVTADRTSWLRGLDLSPATMAKPPEDALDGRAMPIELWPGFPKTTW